MSKSRTKLAFDNIIANALYQFVMLILGFVSRNIFVSTLGISYLGINGLFVDVLNMLSLADLGLVTAMTYSFYKPLAENDREQITKLIRFYKKIYLYIALSITLIGTAITPFIHYLVNIENDIPLLEIYYLFSLGSVVCSYLFVYKSVLITADQKGYVVTRISIVMNIVSCVINIIALLIWHNYILYLAIDLAIKLLTNIIISLKVDKMYPYIKQEGFLSDKETKGILGNVGSIFLYKLSGVLLNATDNILVSILVGTVFVGYYSNYQLITNKLIAFISIVFAGVSAGIGNVIVTENENKRYEIFIKLQNFCFLICGIVVSCFYYLANDFVSIWIGVQYLLSNEVVAALALNLYMSIIFQPLWSYREATGLYKKTKWVMLICAVINLILSVVLGKVWGMFGIFIASVISRVVTYFIYEPVLLYKNFFGKNAKSYYMAVIKNFLVLVINIVVLKYLLDYIVVKSLASLVVKMIFTVGISVIIFVITYRESIMSFLRKSKL